MKTPANILRLCPALLSLAALSVPLFAADLPSKVPLSRYSGLWTNSPFTSPPPPPEAGPTVNPLDDYALTGVSPVPGGHRVTIINKKNPEEKIVLEPGVQREFEVVSVSRAPGKALGTTVVLSSGSQQGTVSFEQEHLALKPPPAAQPPVPNPGERGQNPETPPGVPATEGQRQPRPRIVPPAAGQSPTAAPPQPQGRGTTTQGSSDRRSQGGDRSRRR